MDVVCVFFFMANYPEDPKKRTYRYYPAYNGDLNKQRKGKGWGFFCFESERIQLNICQQQVYLSALFVMKQQGGWSHLSRVKLVSQLSRYIGASKVGGILCKDSQRSTVCHPVLLNLWNEKTKKNKTAIAFWLLFWSPICHAERFYYTWFLF